MKEFLSSSAMMFLVVMCFVMAGLFIVAAFGIVLAVIIYLEWFLLGFLPLAVLGFCLFYVLGNMIADR